MSFTEVDIIKMGVAIPGLRLFENFISPTIHDNFVAVMHKGSPEQNLGHFDGYDFDDYVAFDAAFYPLIGQVVSNLQQLKIFADEKPPIKLAPTLIGYDKDGFIAPHIDSPLLSGKSVVVVSFNSPVVINFYSEKKEIAEHKKIFVRPRSMYVINGEAREAWKHGILPNEEEFEGQKFERERRYALILTKPGPLYSGSELIEYS
jgi:hypothetical protein